MEKADFKRRHQWTSTKVPDEFVLMRLAEQQAHTGYRATGMNVKILDCRVLK
jgi:hypothetical protein